MTTQRSSVLPAPPDEVSAWFARPGAIRRLLPPWLPLKVIEEAGSLRGGTAALGLPGGLRWYAQHKPSDYLENRRFVDELQARGVRAAPTRVAHWRHEHLTEPAGSGHTTVTDRVSSNLPATQIERMLDYRHRQLAADFAAHERASEAGLEPLTIAVTGSNGMVGTALCAFLSTGGHRVIKLVRRAPQSTDERRWDPLAPEHDLLDDCDAVIHLAGTSIFGRFSDSHRQAIEASRIEPTRALAELADRSGVSRFISASAIGIYGASAGAAPIDEQSPPEVGGADFLSGVVQRWEQATGQGETSMRRVQIRTGVVLSPSGGMLAVLRPIFAAGLGGRLGTGEQRLSWVGLDDLIDIYHRALWDTQLSGPVNAVSPHPVSNAEFTSALAKALRRPAIIPVPAAAPKLLLGTQGAKLLAMADQQVIPQKLLDAAHHFRFAQIEQTLAHCLGSPTRGDRAEANSLPPKP
ncbi:TIGR01777 family oxidoreductase [Glutamicibacter sp. AOP12-B1-11]|uniref:TIGR01777 family oxidoreductase n=1 Tax=Glutamicibacter sp. AOP12-B1-11 TaxID=3457725 RepID=UPI004034242D